MDNLRDNTHRSLKNLVSINAWFSQDKEDNRRFTLHADVSFSEERLGGDSDTNITFKLSVKRCDIIFVPPASDPFTIDPASVRSPRPLNPKSVVMKEKKATKASGRAKLSLGRKTAKAAIEAEAGAVTEASSETKVDQTLSMYNEIWKRVNGNHAWSVDGRELEGLRLAGPVFDPHKEPRLVLIDKRSDEQRKKDESQSMNPVASIRICCLREDIDIYEIAYKDPNKQKLFETKKHKDKQMLAARELLKETLVNEGLSAKNIIEDSYAEMTICDVSISIVDESA